MTILQKIEQAIIDWLNRSVWAPPVFYTLLGLAVGLSVFWAVIHGWGVRHG